MSGNSPGQRCVYGVPPRHHVRIATGVLGPSFVPVRVSRIMRIISTLLSTAAFSLVVLAGARGDEPHLDLIRALRAQGEPGLAMDYIQTKLSNPPESIKGILPLEVARTRVELALQESEEGKRFAMLANARAEFEL